MQQAEQATSPEPQLPSGMLPFNIQNINRNRLYVTYALQDASQDWTTWREPGNGFVHVFDTAGQTFSTGSPPKRHAQLALGTGRGATSFGSFAGDLLVGNFGDGRINAFDLTTDTFVGQLTGMNGNPLEIAGLWALTPGNGGSGGNTESIYFSAGPGDESHGLFG